MATYIGPVTTGASFMFGSLQNGIPYLLNGASYNNGIIYYWESNYQTISNSTKIPLFSASGSLSSLILKDGTNDGGLSFRQDGVTIGNANPPTNVTMTQTVYANWTYPDLFLASATYSIFNPSGVLAQVLTNNSGTGPTLPADNIIIIPGTYYYNCTSTSYKQNTQIQKSIKNWFCSINTIYCNDWTLVTGWTELNDCTIGFEYPYCPLNTYCGSIDTCKGPCSPSTNRCTFNDNNYICRQSLSTNWLSSMYFLIAIVFIGFLIVMGMILLFYGMRKIFKPSKTDAPKLNYVLE